MIKDKHPDTSGVHFLVPNSFVHVYELPERMRKTPTSCRLWSPTGTPDEGFNKDAAQDMKFTSGTKGYRGEMRQTHGNSNNVSCSVDTPNAISIRVLRGASRLDTIVVQYAADADVNNALPDHPTTT